MQDSSCHDPIPASRTVTLLGTLDVYGAAAARETLLVLRSDPRLELNLGEVPSCDVSGLQVLLSAKMDAAKNGRALVLMNPSAAIAKACTVLGLTPDQLFNT